MAKLYRRVVISLGEGKSYEYFAPANSEEKIARKIKKQIIKEIKEGKLNIGDDAESNDKKRKRGWKTSQYGVAMLGGSIVSNAWRIAEASSSTDSAQIAQNAYTAVKGTGTLALSTFGGYAGAIIASLIGVVDGLAGQSIKNQIQLSYDNSRLWYNLTRNDIGRNSTYTYDYEQQKWVARDTERIKKNILNQNSSV